MNVPVTPSALTHDDIPEVFTLASLREHFTDDEIAEMNEGDDPILPDADLTVKAPANDDGLDDPGGEADDDLELIEKTAPVVADEPDPVLPAMIDTSAAEATVAELDAKIDLLQTQYDDGDLTAAEWKVQLSTLVKDQAVAQAALNAAGQQAEQGFAAYRESWFARVTDYQAKHAYLAEPEHYDNWDAALKMVNTNTAYQALNMAQKIEQAHRIYAAHYQGVEGKQLPTQPVLTARQKAEVKADADQIKLRTDQRPDAPRTLADLTNASDSNSMEDGRFAQIDRIADQDPVKSEALYAAMSEADQQAYLAS